MFNDYETLIHLSRKENMMDEEYIAEWESAGGAGSEINMDEEVLDSEEVVIFTVQIYYTKEFRQQTPDLEGFVEAMLDETNEAYEQSQVPLRIKLHCMNEVDIPDYISTRWGLKYLERMAPTADEVRNSADVAVLLAAYFNNACGQANLYAVDPDSKHYKYALSTVKKACVRSHTFSHEIGHNIGLYHDNRHVNYKYPYGQGGYVERGKSWTGYRTIMAYGKPGYYQRIPYYSNPQVVYPVSGTPTGHAYRANNARLLLEQRFKLASLGDESMDCRPDVYSIEVY